MAREMFQFTPLDSELRVSELGNTYPKPNIQPRIKLQRVEDNKGPPIIRSLPNRHRVWQKPSRGSRKSKLREEESGEGRQSRQLLSPENRTQKQSRQESPYETSPKEEKVINWIFRPAEDLQLPEELSGSYSPLQAIYSPPMAEALPQNPTIEYEYSESTLQSNSDTKPDEKEILMDEISTLRNSLAQKDKQLADQEDFYKRKIELLHQVPITPRIEEQNYVLKEIDKLKNQLMKNEALNRQLRNRFQIPDV